MDMEFYPEKPGLLSFGTRQSWQNYCHQGTKTPGLFFNKTLYLTLCLCVLVANFKVLVPGKKAKMFSTVLFFCGLSQKYDSSAI
jgi:hypothetical protein